jgi:hypothetical protein
MTGVMVAVGVDPGERVLLAVADMLGLAGEGLAVADAEALPVSTPARALLTSRASRQPSRTALGLGLRLVLAVVLGEGSGSQSAIRNRTAASQASVKARASASASARASASASASDSTSPNR